MLNGNFFFFIVPPSYSVFKEFHGPIFFTKPKTDEVIDFLFDTFVN